MNVIYVPTAKYEEIEQKLSCGSLAEKGICQTFFWGNVEYVCQSAVGNGTGIGWACFWASRVEDLTAYKGSLKPLTKSAHYAEVQAGTRKVGYAGQIVKTGTRQIVMYEQDTEFREMETGDQLTLF